MDVADIQSALIARGYDLGPTGADGDAGPKTIAALASFQRSIGLPGGGIAGPKTIAALAKPTPLSGEPAPSWLALARAEIGTLEGAGAANSPKVIAYFRDAGFGGIREDSVAWCAAFVGAILKRSGIAPSGSLAARSYESWGVGLREPALGCIATKKRGGSSWQGHVGLVVGATSSTIFLLGGNQADSVSIASFKRAEFTAFRWPGDVPLPPPTPLPATIAGARSGVSEA
mgnify:CR=1 FL=1|jgi:uncharacterized protein (TIGR02594 family)